MAPDAAAPGGPRPLGEADPRKVGPHRLLGRVGSGGMGTVYLARHGRDGYSAVKVVHPEFAADREFRARFAREVDLVRRVDSPFVPRFRGADAEAATPWLATEYVTGPTLRAHAGSTPLAGTTLTGLAAGMASALVDIHGAGIVHRDLKPGNVVVSGDGPKVLDFGIARALDGTALTRTGGMLGTPGWVAPERYGGSPVSVASDVFAWGGLVAFAATGRNPFGSGSAQVLAQRILSGSPDLDGVPADLLPLVRAALERDPARRPTPEQALRALGSAAPDEEPTAIATRIVGQGWQVAPTRVELPPRRSRPLSWIAAAAALALVAGGVVLWPRVEPAVTGGSGSGLSEAGGAADGGGDGEAASGTEGDGGDAGGSDPWPPPGATNEATHMGQRSEASTDVTALLDAQLDPWSDEVADGAAHITFDSAQPPDHAVVVLDPPTAEGGALEFRGLVQEVHHGFADDPDQFAVATPDGEIAPSGFELGPEGAGDGTDVRTLTLTFDGAPGSGLLVAHESGHDAQTAAAPPVGLCYDTAAPGFSTDYSECT
ncbi:serine/threonine-protein kinase [Nocardiopsis coralli]|uniref:serine/threonine-protein kinase n=1 Tax=Nocardiopsis coralli TaxID=2772213 RepID=UPI001C0F4A79|nr:serine/threonine-protein kinase [Nocardiopsis coralli]